MASKVPQPKQTVCDQSLVLLSAIVKTFTQYSNLRSYLNACADIITNKLPRDSRWLSQCFIKLDLAHIMKLASQWPPLKLLQRKVKEIILRIIGRLMKCTNLEDIYSLLLSFFISITNETNGIDRNLGTEVACEKHCKRLLNIVSTGIIELDEQLDDIIDYTGTDIQHLFEEQAHNNQYEGLQKFNPFEKWAERVLEESRGYMQEETGINPLYAPKIIPYIIKMMKLLPLWSGIMVPFFGYGEAISSSAEVESSFNKLKNVIFKHETLPTDLETFLETHILSLRGALLLKSVEELPPYIIVDETRTKQFDKNINSNLNESRFPLCKSGSPPSKDGAHKCSGCGISVHALPECSAHQLNSDDIRFCFKCYETIEKCSEDNATDNWCRRSKKQLKSSSYVIPNPHLRHINLSSSRQSHSLPLLKNGSRANELKSCSLQSIKANVILSNTCAFDSIASILMVSFCDSQKYSCGLSEKKNKLIDFISKMIKSGINSVTYINRGELIIESLNPNQEELEYNTLLICCETTPKTIFKTMLREFPTVIEYTRCCNKICQRYKQVFEDTCFITYNTISGVIDNLQMFINDRLTTEEKICNYTDCNGSLLTEFEVSPLHLLIEILYWKGESTVQSSEAAPIIEIKLHDIPQTIQHNDKHYELRGVLNYRQGRTQLKNSIGHYSSYTRRSNGLWELYDDLKKKPITVKGSTTVACELIVYTI